VDYDDHADAYATHRAACPAVVERLCGGVGASTRVLEVGCGTGNYIAAVRAAADCGAAGVDPSERMLEVGRSRHPGILFTRARAEALPPGTGDLDLVFSVDVVHHVSDLVAACAEAFRVLARGGRLCTVTDDEATIRGRLHSRYFPESVAVELERYPPLSAVSAALAEAGFADVREERTVSASRVVDAAAYRERAFSSLLLIGDEAHRAGLERLERDLLDGPIAAADRHVLFWAAKA
jgi:SAM-dependent methyltransferase